VFRVAVVLLAILAMTGCAGAQVATPSPTGADASPGPPGPTGPASPAPTDAGASPSPFMPAIQVPGSARSLVDLLSVRTRPDTDATQVDALDLDGELVTDSYRLSTGEFVTVVSGPLVNDGYAWYRVEPIPGVSDVTWDSGLGGVRAGQGWVAGGAGNEPFLEPGDPPAASPAATPRPVELLAVAASGVGQGLSGAFTVNAPIRVDWDAAAPEGGGCQLQIHLVPRAGGSSYQIVSGAVGGLPQGDSWTRQLPAGDYSLRVDGRCSWAVLVVEIG
jgi:hypothetical protein